MSIRDGVLRWVCVTGQGKRGIDGDPDDKRRCDRGRALDAAEQALAEIEARVGAALIRVTEDGRSRNDAYESLGLSRAA